MKAPPGAKGRSEGFEFFMSQSSVQNGIEYDGLSTEITAVVGFIELNSLKHEMSYGKAKR